MREDNPAPSERILRRIDTLLDAADQAIADQNWALVRQHEQALEVCAKVRFRPETAITCLHLAELLLDEAHSSQPSAVGPGVDDGSLTADKLKAEGSQHLDFAIEEFRATKMQPYLERALRHKGLLQA